jgi:hypothetical protein
MVSMRINRLRLMLQAPSNELCLRRAMQISGTDGGGIDVRAGLGSTTPHLRNCWLATGRPVPAIERARVWRTTGNNNIDKDE